MRSRHEAEDHERELAQIEINLREEIEQELRETMEQELKEMMEEALREAIEDECKCLTRSSKQDPSLLKSYLSLLTQLANKANYVCRKRKGKALKGGKRVQKTKKAPVQTLASTRKERTFPSKYKK